MKITAAVMEKADGLVTRRTIRLAEVDLEGPRAGEVLIKVSSCGVCGTDRGVIHGLEPFPTPGMLGHEGAGTVEEVGPGVTSVRRGDRVMVGFPFCGACRTCRRGDQRYCTHDKALMFGGCREDGSSPMTRGSEPLAGRFFQQSTWATHAIATERQLAKVPDGLDLDQAHLCAPGNVFTAPTTFPGVRTPEEYAEEHGEVMKQIADLHPVSLDVFYAHGDRVCLRYTAKWSHCAEPHGEIPPTGRAAR